MRCTSALVSTAVGTNYRSFLPKLDYDKWHAGGYFSIACKHDAVGKRCNKLCTIAVD